MSEETIFGEGFYFDKPHPNAPEFVKGKLSIQVEKAIAFLTKHKNEKGYVNLDLLKGKEKEGKPGTLYFKLNTFKPTPKVESKPIDYPESEINPDEIPF